MGGQVLFGKPRPDQREKNSPTGRLGETGRRDELGQACAAVARRPQNAQKAGGSLNALRAGGLDTFDRPQISYRLHNMELLVRGI